MYTVGSDNMCDRFDGFMYSVTSCVINFLKLYHRCDAHVHIAIYACNVSCFLNGHLCFLDKELWLLN